MPKKRGNGEGSISRYPDGRWCGRYTISTANGPKRKAVYGRTRAEVDEKLTKAKAERNAGLAFYAGDLTLGEHLNRWLLDCRPGIRRSTWERYEQNSRLHIAPALGAVKLKNLTPDHARNLYREKLASGLSPRTVQYVHATLHKALKQAVDDGLLPRNVAGSVKAPRPQKKEIPSLNPEQARDLLEAAKGDRLEALYVLAVTVGLRQGELLGLKWEDVDLDRGVLRVRRSLAAVRDGAPVFNEPKTAKGRRSVTLPDMTVEALKRHREEQLEEESGLGTLWEEHGLVFPDQVGKPMRRWTLNRRSLVPLLERAGLPGAVTFHGLRHTCATLMHAAEVQTKVVSEMLGHADVAITLSIYSHVLPNMQDEAARRMNELFS
jgi:integrase